MTSNVVKIVIRIYGPWQRFAKQKSTRYASRTPIHAESREFELGAMRKILAR